MTFTNPSDAGHKVSYIWCEIRRLAMKNYNCQMFVDRCALRACSVYIDGFIDCISRRIKCTHLRLRRYIIVGIQHQHAFSYYVCSL